MFINIKCIYYFVHKHLKKNKKKLCICVYFINGYCLDDNYLRPKMMLIVNQFFIKYCELNMFSNFLCGYQKIKVISKIKIHDCL